MVRLCSGEQYAETDERIRLKKHKTRFMLAVTTYLFIISFSVCLTLHQMQRSIALQSHLIKPLCQGVPVTGCKSHQMIKQKW